VRTEFARGALIGCATLAALQSAALVVQAWALATILTGPSRPFALLAGAVLARALFGWATSVVAARAAAGAKEELRARLLDRAIGHGPEWIAERRPAELMSLATKGLDALDAYFTSYLPALVTAVVTPLGIGAVVLFADWPSAVVLMVTLPLIPVFAALIGLSTKDRVAASVTTTQRLSGHLLELVRALPVLTAFRRAQAQAAAVRRVSENHRRASMSTLRVAFSSALALELIATLSVALIAVLVGFRLLAGDLSLAVGLFVLILAPECYLPLRAAGAAHHASEDGVEAVRRVSEIAEPPAVPTDRLRTVHEEVEVRDLRVARRDGYAPDGLSFTVRRGRITCLDAPSGAGKSTAIAVLLGYVTPESGAVLIDGVPLSTVDPASVRRVIAYVPQHPAFTGGTAAAELELAVSTPVRRGELETVARQVVAEHLLDRRVAELSTGERQRVAVARALLRLRHGARLLLLDEPTAHLDPDTAATVMAAVRSAAADGAAVLIASHRVVGAGHTPDQATERVRPQPDTPEVATPKARSLLTGRLLAGAALGAGALICGVALTATSAWLIARAAQQPPVLTLSVAVVGVRAFGLARAGLRYAERLVSHDAAFRLAAGLRTRLWTALVRLGPARTITLRRTEGLQRLVDDVDAVRDLTPTVLLPPLVAAATCAAAVAVQLVILPSAGLVLAAAVLVAGLAAPTVAVALDRRSTAKLAQGRRKVAAEVLTLLEAAPDLISFGAHDKLRAELAVTDKALAATARRQAFGAGAAGAVITLATGAAAVVGTWLAAGTLDPVLVPVLALVPLALAEPLALLAPAAQHRATLRQAHSRVHALLATRDEPAPPHTGPEIRLDGVDVRWPNASTPTLTNVNLAVPPGAHVVVTGPSGVGKSTLLALLLGFLPPERGSATIPRQVSWCPQEPQLVSTTVRENLRIGDPDADDAMLAAALEQAGIGEWADRLDDRLGAVSGGEAQRIALARALLAAANADLVLLDEPTAHLDVATATTVLGNLREALAGQTVVHVTHRPEEADGADLAVELA
jgi:thiol reductant ABC exporter CydD subunit/thiol reductant ABC exporter CydC subunit